MLGNANIIGKGGGLKFPKNGLMWSPFFNEAYSVNSGVSVDFDSVNSDYMETNTTKVLTGNWEFGFTDNLGNYSGFIGHSGTGNLVTRGGGDVRIQFQSGLLVTFNIGFIPSQPQYNYRIYIVDSVMYGERNGVLQSSYILPSPQNFQFSYIARDGSNFYTFSIFDLYFKDANQSFRFNSLNCTETTWFSDEYETTGVFITLYGATRTFGVSEGKQSYFYGWNKYDVLESSNISSYSKTEAFTTNLTTSLIFKGTTPTSYGYIQAIGTSATLGSGFTGFGVWISNQSIIKLRIIGTDYTLGTIQINDKIITSFIYIDDTHIKVIVNINNINVYENTHDSNGVVFNHPSNKVNIGGGNGGYLSALLIDVNQTDFTKVNISTQLITGANPTAAIDVFGSEIQNPYVKNGYNSSGNDENFVLAESVTNDVIKTDDSYMVAVVISRQQLEEDWVCYYSNSKASLYYQEGNGFRLYANYITPANFNYPLPIDTPELLIFEVNAQTNFATLFAGTKTAAPIQFESPKAITATLAGNNPMKVGREVQNQYAANANIIGLSFYKGVWTEQERNNFWKAAKKYL
jgi:hypothetical protein